MSFASREYAVSLASREDSSWRACRRATSQRLPVELEGPARDIGSDDRDEIPSREPLKRICTARYYAGSCGNEIMRQQNDVKDG